VALEAGGGKGRAGAVAGHAWGLEEGWGEQEPSLPMGARGGEGVQERSISELPRLGGTPVRGGHGNQRRGWASRSAPSRGRRDGRVTGEGQSGGLGWLEEGRGTACTLKRIDLDGFEFIIVGLDWMLQILF